MKKRVLPLVLTMMTLVSLNVKAAGVTYHYEYEQIIDLYLENSPDVKIQKMQTELIQLQLTESEKVSRDTKREMEKEEENYKKNKDDEEKRDDYYKLVEAYADAVFEEGMIRAQGDYKNETEEGAILTKMYGVEELLWQYYVLTEQVTLLEDNIAFYDEVLAIEETKEEIGMGTGLEVIQAANTLNNMNNQLSILESMIIMLEDMIKIEAGIALEREIELQLEAPEAIEAVDMNLSFLMEQYMKKNIDLKLKEQETLLSKERQNYLTEIFQEGTEQYDEANWNYQMTLINEQEFKNNTNNKIINEYSLYQQAVDQYRIAKDVYQVKQQQYEDASDAHEEGRLSQMDYKGLELELVSSKLDYEKAIIQYNLAVERIQLIFKGIAVE